MRTKTFLVIGILLLLVLPVFSFVSMGAATADDGVITTIEKYPGPFGPYEKDIVTIACAQIEPIWGDNAATLEKMKAMTQMAADKGANIILFSENVLNSAKAGASREEATKLLEPLSGPSAQEMAKLTQRLGVYVVYGFREQGPDAAKSYNSAAIIGPNGIIGAYRKIQPTPTDTVKRGYTPVAFKTPWGPIGISTCSDTYGFPELARTYALMGARVLLVPSRLAQGGGQREQVPEALKARACENFFVVAMCNTVGTKEPYNYWGESFICANMGITYRPEVLAGPASDTKDDLIMATIDLKNQSDRWRHITQFFEICPNQGEPLFLPQLYADIWGSIGGKPTAAELEKQLAMKDQELEALKLEENAKLGQAQQNFYVAAALAGVLLVSTITLGVMTFRRSKK